MNLANKIFLSLYYLLWIVFLGLAYAYLSDKFYQLGRLFGLFVGILATSVTLISVIILLIRYNKRPEQQHLKKKFLWLIISPLFFLIPAIVISQIPNKLNEKEETIELEYISWACDCANWAKVDDIKKYWNDNDDKLSKLSIFIEAVDKSVELPDQIGGSGDKIKLTGHFYKNKGFPKGYRSFEYPEKARVFRYSKYKIIKSNN